MQKINRMILMGASAALLLGLGGCKPGVYYNFKSQAQQQTPQEAPANNAKARDHATGKIGRGHYAPNQSPS
jgi:hypothetical protein